MGAIRLFLALVVATDHTTTVSFFPHNAILSPLFKLGMNAGFAVSYFYIISGFLISTALHLKYGTTARGVRQFYQSRFVRIFSLYWPMMIVALALDPAARVWLGSAPLLNVISGIGLFGIDLRLSFAHYPQLDLTALIPGLMQAWTLGIELTFYLLAPVLLRSQRLALGILCASLAMRLVVKALWGFDEIWSYTAFPSVVCFFIMGHFARFAGDAIGLLKSRWLGLTLLAVSVAIRARDPLTAWDTTSYWGATVVFAACLPGVFAATKDNKALNLLGDLSYPVYLVHTLVIQFAQSGIIALTEREGAAAGVALTTAAVLATATVAHAIERCVALAMNYGFAKLATIRTVPASARAGRPGPEPTSDAVPGTVAAEPNGRSDRGHGPVHASPPSSIVLNPAPEQRR
jgi:peptidoglycan/LPS O-acetylase OafA/YrhL